MASKTRHILITGGSRGIGLSIARLFASPPNSYRCTLLSRSESSLQAALTTLPTLPSSSIKHRYIAGDVSSPELWSTSPSGITQHLPLPSQDPDSQIDVLVNCAGITQASLFTRTSSSEIEKIVNTNLTGMMLGTRFLLRNWYLRRREGEKGGGPVIVNVASLLGVKGGFGAVAYAASKAGVLGFTRALSEELARSGIRVNAIVPGYIETDMTADMSESAGLLRKIPAGRFGKPEEVADAAMFLVRNEYANNCVLNLDGGLSAT